MSIINEALKKAQEHTTLFKEEKISHIPVIKAKEPRIRSKKKWFLILAVIFISITGFIAFGLVTNTVRDLSMPPVTITDLKAAKPIEKEICTGHMSSANASKKQKPAYVAEDYDYRSLELNGIIFGAGTPFAVINNQIVEEGDKIGKAKVVSIGKNEVKLQLGKKEIILSLK